MRITVIGRGNVGGGLARLWEQSGHEVSALGSDGGDASVSINASDSQRIAPRNAPPSCFASSFPTIARRSCRKPAGDSVKICRVTRARSRLKDLPLCETRW